jgi:uncharacterized protein with HEPN domain
MKKSITESARVQHLIDASREILNFVDGMNYDAYREDRKTQLAITRLIEIIGEASTHISEDTKISFPTIDWRVLKGIRNIIVHEYFGINYELIWIVTQQDIPALCVELEEILIRLNFTD